MGHILADKLKVGDKIRLPIMTHKGSYSAWVLVEKINKARVYSPALAGKHFGDYIDVQGKILNGIREGEQVLDTFREDQWLHIPPKPGRLMRMWKALIS